MRTFADTRDIDAFVQKLRQFEKGELGTEEWSAFCRSSGTYGQRQDEDVHMLRVKIPEGLLEARQMEAFADVAETHARGFVHLTTRQNVQLHFLRAQSLEPAMRELARVGLTTKEACGNTVRNITACPLAGVAPDEAFDVTGYGEALTRYLLRHPLGSTLPRKFKIAFEGCPEDHAMAAINDIGFFARLHPEEGQRGFRVTVGGGTATLCASGSVIRDFLPAEDLLGLAEAIVRVFHRDGDREHRQRARMKFLIRKLGFDTFRARVDEELAELHREGLPRLPFDASHPPTAGPPESRSLPPEPAEIAQIARTELRGPGIRPEAPGVAEATSPDASFAAWSATNAREQRQRGFYIVSIRLPLGDVTAGQLRALSRLASAYSDGTVRTTVSQNVLLRWVREEDLEPLFASLAVAGLGRSGAGTVADVTSCPGAESCRLAVTHSRGVADLVSRHLEKRPKLVASVPGLDIKVSGCPNGCGQNHVAGIGLQGSVRQVDKRPLPQYFLTVGGGTGDGIARFGRLAAKIPARRVPEAIERLILLFESERSPGETAPSFFQRVAVPVVQAALTDLAEVLAPVAEADFVDPGTEADAQPTQVVTS